MKNVKAIILLVIFGGFIMLAQAFTFVTDKVDFEFSPKNYTLNGTHNRTLEITINNNFTSIITATVTLKGLNTTDISSFENTTDNFTITDGGGVGGSCITTIGGCPGFSTTDITDDDGNWSLKLANNGIAYRLFNSPTKITFNLFMFSVQDNVGFNLSIDGKTNYTNNEDGFRGNVIINMTELGNRNISMTCSKIGFPDFCSLFVDNFRVEGGFNFLPNLSIYVNDVLTYENITQYNTTSTIDLNKSLFVAGINNLSFFSDGRGTIESKFNITANIRPNATNVSITTLPISAGDTLKGHANYSDPDNDASIHNTTFWYVNKTLILTANNTFTLLGGNVTELSNITFSASLGDNYDNSTFVNSSVANVGDSTPPTLNNCTLEFTTLTDASGNTNNFTCTVTDVNSDVESVKFNLWTPTANLSRSFSFTQAQTVSPIFVIFQSTETLSTGDYSITNVTFKDSSGNEDTNQTTGFNFTVTVAPTPAPGGGGGGGPPLAAIIINETVFERVCNFNDICEGFRGEDFINCGDERSGPFNINGDCGPEFSAVFCIGGSQCIWKFGLVNRIITIAMIIAVVGLLIVASVDQKTFEKWKKKTKEIFKNIRF